MSDYTLGTVIKNLNPWAITAGNVEGITHSYKFFRNKVVGSTNHDYISNFGGNVYPYAALRDAAYDILVVSDDANDTAAGTGARKVLIKGLDSNWEPYEEEITMDGLTPVTVAAGTFKRINSMEVTDAGVYMDTTLTGANIGKITATINSVTCSQIEVEDGSTLQSNYTVAAGHTLFISTIGIHIKDSKIVEVELYEREQCNVAVAPFRAARLILTLDGIQDTRDANFTGAILVPEYTDVYMSGKASSTTATVDGHYDMFLANNTTFKIP